MLLSTLLCLLFLTISGSVYCTSDISNPTPVYVVQGGEAVLQCAFESSGLAWRVYNGDNVNIIASANDILKKYKYNVSTNPSTGLYYRLHILNVGVTDVKKYRCEGLVNGVNQNFYLKLDLLVPPSSLNIENVTPENNRLVGTDGQDLTVACNAVGGKPAPNVILIIEGQTLANKTQSVQYILTAINRSYDRQTVTCQASNPAYSHNSLTDSAVIYLNLKPLQPTIIGNVESIEETKPLDVTCTTTGSRPRATLKWTIGQKDVTSDATERSSHITASDTYTVIYDLTYSVGKSDNGQVLTCKAVNVATASGVQSSIALNVKYAPTVTISNTTYDQNEGIRTVTCIPVGNPNTYTYYKWQHKSKYGVLIREFDGEINGVLTLPNISVEDRYQDSGEYVCTAGNGIVGRDGKIKQTGSGYVTINAQPVITNDNRLTQYGEFGKNVDINVYVYSIPKYTTARWYKGNTPVSSSTKYFLSDRAAIVNDTFHGEDVQLDGYSVMLTIKDLKESDFNVSYILQLSYDASQTVQYTVLLESEIHPQTPANFSLVSSTETSILVEWTPGYSGGHEQIFYLEYRARKAETWSFKEISHNTKQLTSLTYVLFGLQDSTLYELKMYSKNMFSRSLSTDIDIIQTREKQEKETCSSGLYAVIGGMAGVMTVLISIVIILGTLLFRRNKGWSGGTRNEISNRSDNIDEMASPNRITNDMYEDIKEGTRGARNEDLQQRGGNVSTTTYEMLGIQDIPNTYVDLSSEQEQRQSESTTEQYETLGEQNKPNVYEQIKNNQEPEDREYTNLKI